MARLSYLEVSAPEGLQTGFSAFAFYFCAKQQNLNTDIIGKITDSKFCAKNLNFNRDEIGK